MQERENVLLLATLYVAAFVAGFNENLVNMALMSIMSEYSVDSVTAQWLVTGYMIVSTVVVSCMAFLYRRVKLRTLFLAAAILSLGGSVIGLFASSFAMLMAARLVQAVGTGIFIPAMMNSILAVIPKNRLGTFMSIGGCVITFGPAFAPVVCGALVTSFGWHSIFVLPAVVMVLLIGCCFAFVRNLENYPAQLDIPSVALSAVGLTAFVYGMAEITANVPLAVGALAVALASIVGFAHRQFHCESPLIELVPMKNKRFVMPLLLVMMAMMTTFSMSVLLPLYFEGALGMTALFAGVVMLVPVLSNAGATLFGGRFMDKRGEWPLLPAGFACIVVGLALMIALGRTMVLPGVFAGGRVRRRGIGDVSVADSRAEEPAAATESFRRYAHVHMLADCCLHRAIAVRRRHEFGPGGRAGRRHERIGGSGSGLFGRACGCSGYCRSRLGRGVLVCASGRTSVDDARAQVGKKGRCA